MISTIGVPISSHYCGAKLVSVSITNEAKSCCKGMRKCSGCCKNESHFYKIQNEYTRGEILQINPDSHLSFLSDLFCLYPKITGFEGNIDSITIQYKPYISHYHEPIFISSGGDRAPPFLA
jgi:hypothetical protein